MLKYLKYGHLTAYLYFFSKVKIKSSFTSISILACQLRAPSFANGVVWDAL